MNTNWTAIKKAPLNVALLFVLIPMLNNAHQSNYHLTLTEKILIKGGMAVCVASTFFLFKNALTRQPLMNDAHFIAYAVPTLINMRINHQGRYHIVGLQNAINFMYGMLIIEHMWTNINQSHLQKIPLLYDSCCLIPPAMFFCLICGSNYT